DLQHDHFLRERGEEGLEGGKRAARLSAERFKKYFVAAAWAAEGRIRFIDGGLTTRELDADRRWFLFGRALHLFQDSFSPEHTTRTKDWKRVIGVKTFVCTKGSEQHTHNKPLTSTYILGDADEDIIWTSIPWKSVVLGEAMGRTLFGKIDRSEG